MARLAETSRDRFAESCPLRYSRRGAQPGWNFWRFSIEEELWREVRELWRKLYASQMEVSAFQRKIHIPLLRERVFWCVAKA